jgi:hypothetical protein
MAALWILCDSKCRITDPKRRRRCALPAHSKSEQHGPAINIYCLTIYSSPVF